MCGSYGLCKFKKKGNGFTLVELIVVLVIIAILAALAVPTFLAFIDKGRENEYKTNATKSLSATQGALSALFSDASNRLTPEMRNKVKATAGVGDSSFVVWTKEKLVDGQTKALPANIASFTVDKALYGEAGVFFSYVNGNWEKLDATDYDAAIAEMAADNQKAIYMWPYKWDSAYLDDDGSPVTNPDDDDENSIKVVLLKLSPDYLRYVYFTRENRNINSGLENIRVLFWKEGNQIKSTWDIKSGKDIFEGEDGYTYELYLEQYTYLGWVLDSANVPPMSVSAIRDYVFNDASKANYYEFTIGLEGIDPDAEVEYINISRNRFTSFIASSQMDINSVERAGRTTYPNKDSLPSQKVRIDDESVPEGYAYAWRDGNKIIWWSNAAKNYMPADCSSLFASNTRLVYFDFSGLDFSKTTTMNSMFAGCTRLEAVSGIGTGTEHSLTDVGRMFAGCSSLIDSGTDTLSTGALTDVKGMFENCASIVTIELSDYFDTSNVTDFENMFSGCTNVADISASKIDTSSAETMKGMFENCSSLNTPDVSTWNTANCINLENTFRGCESMGSTMDLSGWNLGRVETMESTFEGCRNLPEIKISASGWNLMNCTTLARTFKGCSNLSTLDSRLIGSSRKLKTVNEAFAGCYSLETINLSRMSFAGASDMSELFSMEEFKNDPGFAAACSLKTVKFSSTIDTSNVTDMNSMFRDCISLTDVDGIASFRTEKVSDMSYMFAYTNALQEIDLSSFNTLKVSNYEGMFFYEAGKSSLATVYASPRFNINDKSSHKMFMNNILVGGRNTEFVQKSNDGDPDFDNAEYAKADGWQGEEGYFKAKYREVYVSRSGLAGMFSEPVTAVVKVDSDAYTPSTIQNIEGLVNIENKDATKQTDYYIFAWHEGSVLKWWTDADIAILDAECKAMFGSNKANVISFDFTGFCIRDVTGFNETFSGCTNLESVYFGNMFYADQLRTAEKMFSTCRNLTYVDMQNFHAPTGSLTNVKYMFQECNSLTSINFAADFNTQNITSGESMFYNCKELTSIDVSMMNFEKVGDTHRMFSGLEKVTSIVLPDDCNLKNCTNMGAMFEKCYLLTSIDTDKIQTSNKLTNISYIFNMDKALETVDISSWNISSVTNYSYAFRDCDNLTSVVMKGGKTQGINRTDLFSGCDGGATGEISITLQEWRFDSAANVGNFISSCTIPLVDYDISGSDMNSVTTFINLVKNRSNLRSINLSNLQGINNVTSFESAFSKCSKLESIELGGMDISKILSFKEMFNGCTNLKSVDFTGYTNKSVTNVEKMFIDCKNLETIDFGGISFEKVTSGAYAFSNCSKLAEVYVSDSYGLNTAVNNTDMFNGNTNLVGSEGFAFQNTGARKKGIYAWPDGKNSRDGYFRLK